MFYRLISGLHTSIAVHIAKHYLLNEVTEEVSLSGAVVPTSVNGITGKATMVNGIMVHGI